jgi:hypothetical protein
MMSGNQTNVPMKVAAGMNVPTQVHLPDATTIFPDSSRQFMVPAAYVTAMINAGLQIVVSSGTTHVP